MKTKSLLPKLDTLIQSLKTEEIDDTYEMLSPTQVASELKLHINTVYRIIGSGQLKAYNLSSGNSKTYYRVKRVDLENYLDDRYYVR